MNSTVAPIMRGTCHLLMNDDKAFDLQGLGNFGFFHLPGEQRNAFGTPTPAFDKQNLGLKSCCLQ